MVQGRRFVHFKDYENRIIARLDGEGRARAASVRARLRKTATEKPGTVMAVLLGLKETEEINSREFGKLSRMLFA